MRIVHVCSEFYPLLKTGGLADVAGALPAAQNRAGADARLLLPGLPALARLDVRGTVAELDTFAGPATLRYCEYNGLGLYRIDAPHLYDRPGSPYHDEGMRPWPDNPLRFALLGWIASRLALGLDPFWRPDVVHGHDWHAGLAPAYMEMDPGPAKSVFTVHNLAYQGECDAALLPELGLAPSLYAPEGLEFYGTISFLKAGLVYADAVTTVSPTYAREITTPEFGCRLDGVLRRRSREGTLHGILNGVDYAVWNPETDSLIPHRYGPASLADKAVNREWVRRRFGLGPASGPLFAIVSRLAEQKGLDVALQILSDIRAVDGQLVLLGSGEARLENAFREAAARHPETLAVHIGYDERLSHCLIAGADSIMVPSRFEPCGLTQLYGLRYGTLPLVRCTGGLADTVADCTPAALKAGTGTGFVFDACDASSLGDGVRRAAALLARPRQWRRAQQGAMAADFSWRACAEACLDLYRRL